MPTYGVTATGFVIRTLDNLDALVISAVQAAIGVLPVDALLVVLQIINERFAELWQLGEAVYNAGDVDAATGDAQDKINSVTGTVRNKARASTVTLTWTGNPGVSVINGARVKTSVSLQPFATALDLTGTGLIVATPAWQASHVYVVGDRVTNVARCYIATAPGTSAGSGGPTTTAAAITDNTVTWRYLGEGTGTVDLAAAAVFTGPITALSGSLTVIDTFLSGVLGVINLLDAVLGADIETHADYRVRREQELAQPGSGTASAIASAATEVVGISNVTVFQNTTDGIVNGMLPHSVELLAVGGSDTEIATLLLNNVDAGIQTVGNTSVVLTDDQGFLQTIFFSRPAQKLIYNTITYNVNAKLFPSDGAAHIIAAIVAGNVARGAGDDVESTFVASLGFQVAGVRGFTSSLQSVFPVTVPVASTLISIASRELAVFDSSRIVININPVTP